MGGFIRRDGAPHSVPSSSKINRNSKGSRHSMPPPGFRKMRARRRMIKRTQRLNHLKPKVEPLMLAIKKLSQMCFRPNIECQYRVSLLTSIVTITT